MESQEHQKRRAIKKLNLELNKNINELIEMVNLCGMGEFLILLVQLHLTRIMDTLPNDNVNPYFLKLYANLLEESLKYVIQLYAKYGYHGLVINKSTKQAINLLLVEGLTKQANIINSKYEALSLVQLFEVEVKGKRDQFLKIDMGNVMTNEHVNKFQSYYLRVDADNNSKKNSKKDKDVLFKFFKLEYAGVEDLFFQEFEISVDDYIRLIDDLLIRVSTKIGQAEEKSKKLANGNVDMDNLPNLINFGRSFFFNKDDLLQSMDSRYVKVIQRLIFQADNFDPLQLRFHKLTRQPIIELMDSYLLSPELILDSLFFNTHYTMLESLAIKNEYVARQSSSFLDKLLQIASKYGYEEIDREKNLFEGKKELGDIDLLLKNKVDHYLLIEAKNHAIPLDVYFKDILKTQEHLTTLKEKWEQKVLKRLNHLKVNHMTYSIPSSFDYIIVSRYPEIISHYSDLFIISLLEFESWMDKHVHQKTFQAFHDDFYKESDKSLSLKDLENFQKENMTLFRFEDPEKGS